MNTMYYISFDIHKNKFGITFFPEESRWWAKSNLLFNLPSRKIPFLGIGRSGACFFSSFKNWKYQERHSPPFDFFLNYLDQV